MDLLKELAREETACEAAGELGAIEPLMALLTASTARNDMGLQVTAKRSSQSSALSRSNGCRPSQRATTKCLELLQRAAPNRERKLRELSPSLDGVDVFAVITCRSKSFGFASITSKAWVPIEPVDPKIATPFFPFMT